MCFVVLSLVVTAASFSAVFPVFFSLLCSCAPPQSDYAHTPVLHQSCYYHPVPSVSPPASHPLVGLVCICFSLTLCQFVCFASPHVNFVSPVFLVFRASVPHAFCVRTLFSFCISLCFIVDLWFCCLHFGLNCLKLLAFVFLPAWIGCNISKSLSSPEKQPHWLKNQEAHYDL